MVSQQGELSKHCIKMIMSGSDFDWSVKVAAIRTYHYLRGFDWSVKVAAKYLNIVSKMIMSRSDFDLSVRWPLFVLYDCSLTAIKVYWVLYTSTSINRAVIYWYDAYKRTRGVYYK